MTIQTLPFHEPLFKPATIGRVDLKNRVPADVFGPVATLKDWELS